MTEEDARARTRYFMMTGVRIAAVGGAVLGLMLVARATAWPAKVLGAAIVLSALLMIATVPRALARRWRTPLP